MHLKRMADAQKGFTLAEMMIVLMIMCIITPIAFLSLAHLSDELTMRHFVAELGETVHDVQMEAMSDSKVAEIVFDNERHCYYLSIGGKTVRTDFNSRIQIYSSYHGNEITINRLGHFSTIKTLSITMDSIRYQFVLLLGQGRFYYEKTSG